MASDMRLSDYARAPYNREVMKRRDVEGHLRSHRCSVLREGGNHTIWRNDENGKITAVPRHADIKTPTVREICKALDIPQPVGR